ncbi:hypothetical protein EWM64_g3702 [Hericium alpestre]|uniref:RRM domain-containing protein n=1 Tax=Hericium alpestre TaxID=135208 RepID=A0A4Z0A1X0_9AGAM|nr:hypothetical protein EWM64_g3702 [Hericium alpestre]
MPAHKAPLRPRSWGTRFDSLTPSTPPPQSQISHNISTAALGGTTDHPSDTNSYPSPHFGKKEEKDTHDASVFVGSLPTHVDHHDLSRLLSEHLSVYAVVKNVKVIRDARGGVCAFVQCEDAASAAQLVRSLHGQPPKPFMGRFLRYEQARIQRTLLFSYRVPTQSAPMKRSFSFYPSIEPKDNVIELEPASAMRLFKPQGSKYAKILYNEEACSWGGSNPNGSGSEFSTNAASVYAPDGVEVFLSPLQYDSDTLYRLVSFFGPVEFMRPYRAEEDMGGPGLHDAPKSPVMDPGCWEVKWEHREDCVTALTTLRSVPHLSVTWAHMTRPPASSQGNYVRSRSHSFSSSQPDHQNPASETAQGLEHPRSGPSNIPFKSSHLRTATYSTLSSDFDVNTTAGTIGSPISSRHPSASNSGKEETPGYPPGPDDGALGEGNRTIGHRSLRRYSNSISHISPTTLPATSPTSHMYLLPSLDTHQVAQVKTGGSERCPNSNDFPPLALQSGRRWNDATTWSATQQPDCTGEKGGEERTRRFSFTDSMTATSALPVTFPSAPAISSSIMPQVKELLSTGQTSTTITTSAIEPGLDRSVLPSPQSAATPITPEATDFTFPHIHSGAGQHTVGTADADACDQIMGLVNKGVSELSTCDNTELDPSTIFVGGLEMHGPNAWNDDKVKFVFGGYGHIEDIKVVKPINKRSAFAFVRYGDATSASKAVIEQHNHIYDGRHIRVQLRDKNPPGRGSWRFNSRGRPARQFVPRPPGIRNDLGFVIDTNQNPTSTAYSVATPTNSDVESNKYGFPKTPTPESSLAAHTLSSQSSAIATPGPQVSIPLTAAPAPAMAAPAMQYPMFYPAGPWFAQYPYTVPFVSGYGPSYIVPGMQHNGSQPGMEGQVYPVAPYQPYPMYAPVHGPAEPMKQTHPRSGDTQQQPPLVPMGFYQTEQGLVPRYPQDALEQYMSNNAGQSPPTEHGRQPDGDAQRTASTPISGTWPSYPFTPFYHAPSAGPAPHPMMTRGHSYPAPGNLSRSPSVNWYPHSAHVNGTPHMPAQQQQQATPTGRNMQSLPTHTPTPINPTLSMNMGTLFGTGASPYNHPHGEANPSFKRRNHNRKELPHSPHYHGVSRSQPFGPNTSIFDSPSPSMRQPLPGTAISMGNIAGRAIAGSENHSSSAVKASNSSPARFDVRTLTILSI